MYQAKKGIVGTLGVRWLFMFEPHSSCVPYAANIVGGLFRRSTVAGNSFVGGALNDVALVFNIYMFR